MESEPSLLLAMRQANIGRLFQKLARAYSEQALIRLEQYGHTGLTLSHTTLISHLDVEGTQVSTLAERAGITKQAMGQIAKELEAREYIVREPDPDDKRGFLVKFTAKGEQFLQDAYQVKLELEDRYTQALGAEGMQQLKHLLEILAEASS